MNAIKITIKYAGKSRWIVDAPPTGFRSTTTLRKATRFDSAAQVDAFKQDRGIFFPVTLHYVAARA